MLLVLDNGSLFTPRITEILESSQIEFRRLDHTGLRDADMERYDSYILSGRRFNDPAMNVANAKIARHAAAAGKPLLGICYGAQIAALALGATIRRMGRTRRGRDWIEETAPNPLCRGRMRVFESHRYEIARLGDTLERLGRSDLCANELVRARGTDVYGTQFHPEMSRDGGDLLTRFLAI